ncbi:MAG: flagellar hook-length control protein FliK, partial [Bdellovibrionota bacterium]
VESEVDSKDMAAEVNLAVESQVTAPAEVKAQEISQAAAHVDKKVEQEVKPEVQAEEAVEKTPQVAEAKDSSKHQTKSQDKQIASEEVKSVNESPVDKEILKKATEEFKQSKPEAPAQKAPEAAQVSKELDPIQAAAEKVIRELAAQQLANTTSANAVSQALTVHTNKALGTAMMAKQGLEHSVIGQQSQQATLNSTALNPTQSVVSMTDRGAKLETAQRLVKQQALPRAQEQRTMEKVKEVLKEAAKSRDGKTLSLRLDPPSLGSVKIDVTFKDGALHARIAAESPHVNQLLRERSAELQMLLRRIGLNASTVSVSVQGDDQGFGGETMAGSQDSSNNNGSGMGDDNLQDAHVMDGSSPSLANESVLDHWVA